MIKIVDCFTVCNNLDLLNYRLTILNKVVDYFVIVKNKLNIKDINEEFNKKIIYVNDESQDLIFKQDAIKFVIDKIEDLTENDVIIISDLNEIPNPKTLLKIKQGQYKIEINILEMEIYYQNLNTKLLKNWYYTKIISYKNYIKLKLKCSDIRNIQCYIIPNGGWYLSNFDKETISENEINNIIGIINCEF